MRKSLENCLCIHFGVSREVGKIKDNICVKE